MDELPDLTAAPRFAVGDLVFRVLADALECWVVRATFGDAVILHRGRRIMPTGVVLDLDPAPALPQSVLELTPKAAVDRWLDAAAEEVERARHVLHHRRRALADRECLAATLLTFAPAGGPP